MNNPLYLDGKSLSLSDVISVARFRRRVYLSEQTKTITARCRAVIDVLVENNIPVYGLTTGFGSKRNVFIDKHDTTKLQHNLIKSHASGIGTPLPEDVVRAALLLRANALSRGHSGIRTIILEKILEILNKDIYPWVPDQGSVSASGDLAPLSHLSLVLVGDEGGKIYDPSKKRETERAGDYEEKPDIQHFIPSTADNLKKFHNYNPVSLEAKEGLALTNGVQVTCALGIINAFDVKSLIEQADISCSVSMEALKGILTAYDAEIAEARPYPGQIASAANMKKLLESSSILSLPLNLAILNKAIGVLKESSDLADPEFEKNLKNVIEGLEEYRNDPHKVIENFKGITEQNEMSEAGFYISGDPASVALRETLKPWQLRIQDMIKEIFLSNDEQPGKVQLRENLTSVADLLEKAVPKIPSVQDDYSFRCAPQVHGAVRNALAHVVEILLIEANSSTDNPLIFPPAGPEDPVEYKNSLNVEECRKSVKSGGNFHGEPLALAMDYLTTAVAELGSIAERRVAKIVDGKHNNGLPSLLINKSGLNSGFMIPQYTAAALVSENKSISFPASVDSIPTCENTEDHVSMGLIGARKTRMVIENVEKIIAIELLTSFQGVHFRQPFHKKLGKGTQLIFDLFEQTEEIEFVSEDRILAPLISASLKLVRSGKITETVNSEIELNHYPEF